jgi:hypothetical protein
VIGRPALPGRLARTLSVTVKGRARWLFHALLLTASLALTACAPTTASGPLTPLVVGWEQFFKLTWTVSEHQGRPVVSGRIYNNWNFAAANVRLLVDELDANGQIVDQKIGWLGFTLTPGTTAPFEIPVNHATPNHRVSVFAFDWIQTNGGRWRRF